MVTVQPVKKLGLDYYGVFVRGVLVGTYLSEAIANTKKALFERVLKAQG